MKRFWIRKGIGICFLIIVGIMVFSGIVMLLWNALLPQLFHFPVITWPQALGLLLLCKILFGGFRGPGGGPHRRREWKEKMKQKWMNMTPEERERFKGRWGRRCGDAFGAEWENELGTRPGGREQASQQAGEHNF
jgi:hypothetical protein